MERRHCYRLKIELPAKIQAIGKDTGRSVAVTVDVSALGFRILTNESLIVDQEISMQICINNETLDLRVKVVWISEEEISGEKRYTVGVKILETPAQNELKFVRFFAKKLLEFFQK
ncbi:MAG: PilZ domain-containing protein [Candidatus Omnitrophica bacterium]|nr:PilZ domain-containing protein [Candidatus Omnitrophota bacterium]